VPVLHRNIISFFGMRKRSEYICFRKIHDKLIALDEDNVLTTWSVVTGKILEQNKIKNEIDFSSYGVYSCETLDTTYKREWYQPYCLLKCKNAVENIEETKFFDPTMLQTSLENNTAYLKIM
jgi:hypothetical protein